MILVTEISEAERTSRTIYEDPETVSRRVEENQCSSPSTSLACAPPSSLSATSALPVAASSSAGYLLTGGTPPI